MKFGDYPKIGSFADIGAFRAHLAALGLDMPCDDAVASGGAAPLAQPAAAAGMTIGHRIAVQPMEGWDGTREGAPTDNTIRRWRRFGASGAKMIWGGEAVAVTPAGRANPQQLVMSAATQGAIAGLRETLAQAHRAAMGDDKHLVIGLQLTHSGRFCKPNDHRRFEPAIAYRHPLLDRKFHLPAAAAPVTDGEIGRMVEDFVAAARLAQQSGFDFVDLKHCHGYFAHELLSGHTRPGKYGGALANRARFLTEVAAGVRAEAPGLKIGVRLSAFDLAPYRPDPALTRDGAQGPGVPEDFASLLPYRHGFGADANDPTRIDLAETMALFGIFRALDITLVNVTAGSPYYNPHVTRPAIYPPSDGYLPPEDPLVGVMRHLDVTRRLKAAFPDFCLMGSGYSYLQEFLPNVAQAAVAAGWVDLVGLGRIILSYPELPRDILAGGAKSKKWCRTFSDCTTAPRNGLVSGCYPLDPHYKNSPEFKALALVKQGARRKAAAS